MPKSFTVLLIQVLAVGMLLAAYALAQQTPAPTTFQPASAQPASGQPPSSQTTSNSTKASRPAQAGASAAKKASTGTKSAAPLTLKTDKEKESYAMGMDLGTGLHNQGLALDPDLVARGMKDAMSGGKTAMTEDEARVVLRQLQADVEQKISAKARQEGETFLAANKNKEGVVTLPSGLQYKILTQGNGPKPTASAAVSCNYRGTFIDGTEFDSSYKRGQPASFPVGGVIKGWTEALQLMPVGSKWQLFIPPDLAYGDSSRPGIPPGSTLIFEVELLSIGEAKK